MTNVHNLPQVFNMSKLPHNAIGLETLNNANINTNLILSVGNSITETEEAAYANNYTNKLFLKSAVVLNEKETNDNNNNKFIYGSKTYVFNYDNANGNIRVYDPIKESNNTNILPIRKVNYDPARPTALSLKCSDVHSKDNIYIKDKIKDFRTNQTILIYTNELKNIPNNALSTINGINLDRTKQNFENYMTTPGTPNNKISIVYPGYTYADFIKTNYAYCYKDYIDHNTIIGCLCYNKEICIGGEIKGLNLTVPPVNTIYYPLFNFCQSYLIFFIYNNITTFFFAETSYIYIFIIIFWKMSMPTNYLIVSIHINIFESILFNIRTFFHKIICSSFK